VHVLTINITSNTCTLWYNCYMFRHRSAATCSSWCIS